MESIFGGLIILMFLGAAALMFAAFGTAVFLIFRYVTKRKQEWSERLRQFAAEHELEFEPGSFPKHPKATGRLDGIPICIESFLRSGGGSNRSSSLYSRITMTPSIPAALSISKENFLTGIGQKFMGEDLRAGLPLFDDTFVLKGIDDSLALSMLGTRSRDALWRTVRTGYVKVDGGDLTYTQSGYITSAEELTKQVGLLTELARSLTEFAHRPAAGLLHHSSSDPEPAYRSRCFDALLRDYDGTSECEEGLRRAADSTEPNFRFLLEQRKAEPDLGVVADLARSGELDEPLYLAAKAMLGDRFAGGLSLGSEEDGGRLTVAQDGAGGLSETGAGGTGAPEPDEKPQ
jgi:hypothetical protein